MNVSKHDTCTRVGTVQSSSRQAHPLHSNRCLFNLATLYSSDNWVLILHKRCQSFCIYMNRAWMVTCVHVCSCPQPHFCIPFLYEQGTDNQFSQLTNVTWGPCDITYECAKSHILVPSLAINLIIECYCYIWKSGIRTLLGGWIRWAWFLANYVKF